MPLPSFEKRLKLPRFALIDPAVAEVSVKASPAIVPEPMTVPLLTLKYPTVALLVPKSKMPSLTLTSPPVGKVAMPSNTNLPALIVVPPK